MRIDSLVSLIGGELKSRPSVTSVEAVASDPARIRRGDLFVARRKEEIPLALERGAYGILFEGWAQISDPEIAWIKVEDLSRAIIRLIRFILLQKSPAIYTLDPVAFDLAKEIVTEGAHFLGRDPLADLEAIAKKPPRVAIFDESGYFGEMGLESGAVDPLPLALHTATLFESSIVSPSRYYERAPVAPLFLPRLSRILAIAERHHLHHTLRRRPKSHFRPIFIDGSLAEVEFGASDRVIIHEPSRSMAGELREYMERHAPWARTLFVSTAPLEGYRHVSDVDALREILYNWPFRYLCLVGEMPPLESLRRRRRELFLF